MRRGMDEALADLALYLDHGVRTPRHRDLQATCSLGVDLGATFAGAVVTGIHPGGFGEAAGLQPGDVLLQLGTAPVFEISDAVFFQREHDVDDEVEVTFVRGDSVMRARGKLTARDTRVFAHRA